MKSFKCPCSSFLWQHFVSVKWHLITDCLKIPRKANRFCCVVILLHFASLRKESNCKERESRMCLKFWKSNCNTQFSASASRARYSHNMLSSPSPRQLFQLCRRREQKLVVSIMHKNNSQTLEWLLYITEIKSKVMELSEWFYCFDAHAGWFTCTHLSSKAIRKPVQSLWS